METDFRGVNRAPVGQWASCIRIMDALTSSTVSQLFLADNEAAFRSDTSVTAINSTVSSGCVCVCVC